MLEEVSYETLVLETWPFTFGGSLVRSARFGDLVLTFGGSLVRNARFGDLVLHFWRTSCTKRSFWRLGASLLEEVSYEALILETWCFTFGGSLLRNARFGDLARHFWRKSRTKRSFWRLGDLVLLRSARFGELVLHFWRKSRTKRSFWTSLLEEVSYEKRSFWRLGPSLLEEVSCEKRSFCILGALLLEEVSYEALILETWCFTFGGSLVRSARFGDLVLHFWRKSRTKRSF